MKRVVDHISVRGFGLRLVVICIISERCWLCSFDFQCWANFSNISIGTIQITKGTAAASQGIWCALLWHTNMLDISSIGDQGMEITTGSIVSSSRGKMDSETVHHIPSAYLMIKGHGTRFWCWNTNCTLNYN